MVLALLKESLTGWAVTCPAVKNKRDRDKTDIEQENEKEEDDDDDDETPKKRKKNDKPKVWDLIQAQRDDLVIPNAQPEDMEVSAMLE